METFYRFHWADCPPFSADNAWSALWGRERSADGSKTRCEVCDGTGVDNDPSDLSDDDPGFACRQCDGTGWEDAVRGYSCTRSAEALIAYFADPARDDPAPDTGTVIIFEGRGSGTGFDGEPVAVPERTMKSMPWTEFVKDCA